ncbi:MAG: NADH-quinone oxidoreductase subunit J [Thermoplasmatota archaeon]
MAGTGEMVTFAVIASMILASGILAVATRRVFHSALALGACLVSVAALYISTGAQLVGVIQILVYVGGILTLLLFAVMFVAGDEEDEEDPEVPFVE